MTYRISLLAATAALLSACGGSDRDEGIVADPPPITFSSAAIAITEDRLENTLSYARNQTTAITGSADFIGGFSSDLRVNGQTGQKLVGNIDMNMNFATDQITGEMRNMGIATDQGIAIEGVLGTIDLTGTVGPVAAAAKPVGVPGSSSANTGIAQNILQVEGQGILLGNFGEETQGSIQVDVDMIGHARTRNLAQRLTDSPTGSTPRDWFSGVIGGDGQGVHDIDFEGRFYLFEE